MCAHSQPNNSDALVAIGLNLVTVVIECGSSHLCRFPVLASLVQDSLCKHVIQVSKLGVGTYLHGAWYVWELILGPIDHNFKS